MRTLERYDASALVGLRTMVEDAAIEHIEADGEKTIELPKMRELLAAAAVCRCLMPYTLRGKEIKAMRKIMGLTLADLAKKLGDRAAPETVSRWESEAQPMGGYAEKVFRLVVCTALKAEAPGVDYHDGMIADLVQIDPRRKDPNFEVPYVELVMARVKENSGMIDAWTAELCHAA
jgi:DNA-binding transcriptional regulator YiaG